MKNTFDDLYYKAIGTELRKARMSNHFSYDKVALLLNGHKSKSMLIRYESGQYRIDNDTLDKLCEIYGASAEDIRANAYDNAIKQLYSDDDDDDNTLTPTTENIEHTIHIDKEHVTTMAIDNNRPRRKGLTLYKRKLPSDARTMLVATDEKDMLHNFRNLTESQQNIIMELIKELSK